MLVVLLCKGTNCLSNVGFAAYPKHKLYHSECAKSAANITFFAVCYVVLLCSFFISFIISKFDVHRAVNRNIISIAKPTRCTNVSILFYFGMTFYMFRTVFPSIIRSSRLYIQQPNRYCCLLASNVSNLFYFGMTLYVFRTVFPSIIRSSRLYIQQQAFVKQILLSAC